MIQHGEHIEEHESIEEDAMHSMHDEPFLESQLEAHVEPMIEADEHPYLGSAIIEGKTNIQVACRVVVLLDKNPLQEYINRGVQHDFSFLSIIGKDVGFLDGSY